MQTYDSGPRKEKRRHSSLYIPYTYYDCAIPEYYPFVPLHWHNEFEMNYITTGEGIFRYGDRTVRAGAGDIILILPNMLHSIQQCGEGKLRYDTLIFSQSALGCGHDERCYTDCISAFCMYGSNIRLPVTRRHPEYKTLKMLAEEAVRCAKADSGRCDLLLKTDLMRIFMILSDNGDLCAADGKKPGNIDIIRPAVEYINGHYQENISVPELSEKVHLSSSYFMSLFRKTTGMSVVEYANQLRIRAVCDLLAGSDIRASEAAFTCGFRNLSNFNRQFRRYTGLSPSEYRAMTAAVT